MLMLPTKDIGTNNIGKVMPIITPKLEIASPDEYPETTNIAGIIKVVIGWTIELANLTPVMGAELLIRDLYSPFLKLNLHLFKYINKVMRADAKHVKLNAIAEYFVATKKSVILNNIINVKANLIICSISSVNPQLK